MIDVSIIIVNYNTCELTKQCIDSIFEKTDGVSFEVIVVDNDSKDDSIKVLSQDSRITFVASDANLGFGKANNLGVEHSLGKYIFFLNSDTLLVNNAVKLFFDFMEQHQINKSVGAIGCLLMDNKLRRIHSFADFPKVGRFLADEWADHFLKRFNKSTKRLDDRMEIPVDKEFFSVDYVTGADIFVNRSVLEKYGGFDKDFFMYYEETEMQNRWKRLGGLQSFIVKGPEIIHLEGKSQQGQNYSKYLRQLRSQMIYFKKTCSPVKYYTYRIAFMLGRIITLPFQKITKEQKKEYLNIIFNF